MQRNCIFRNEQGSHHQLLTATPGSTYSYDIVATDADGDRLSYSLNLDALGRLRWTPTNGNVGSHTVVITVYSKGWQWRYSAATV